MGLILFELNFVAAKLGIPEIVCLLSSLT